MLSLELAQVRARVAALALQVCDHTELVRFHMRGVIHPRDPARRPPKTFRNARDTWDATHTMIYTMRHPRDQAALSAASDACALGACSCRPKRCVRVCVRPSV